MVQALLSPLSHPELPAPPLSPPQNAATAVSFSWIIPFRFFVLENFLDPSSLVVILCCDNSKNYRILTNEWLYLIQNFSISYDYDDMIVDLSIN